MNVPYAGATSGGKARDEMVQKGRSNNGYRVGASNGASKVTPRQVYDIWRCIQNGQTNTAIGQRFGITHSAVSRIRLQLAWKHLTERLGPPRPVFRRKAPVSLSPVIS